MEGKAREDFEEWWYEEYLFGAHHIVNFDLDDFYELPMKSMQFGVIQDFFDSVGIVIACELAHANPVDFEWSIYPPIKKGFCSSPKLYKTRSEARESAIKKAVEIYNENKK